MVRDFLMRKRKIAESKISMMFHAIPPEKYFPVSEDRIIRIKEMLAVNGKVRIVGTVTKLGPQRGNKYLLKAASEVLKVCPNVLFLLIYKVTHFHRLPNQKYVEIPRTDREKLVTELKDMAKELGIEKNIRLIEWPENVDELVAACDLMVAPFLSERFSSVKLLEAMAMGKPLIATSLGEQREIIKNGGNGYLVAPGDVQKLAQKILEVLSTPERLEQLSCQARMSAEQYSVNAYVQTLQDWYTELAVNSTAKD
jgi:glycosyltransferase involved in cell wall biosynthesis